GPHHDQWRPRRPHRADLDADDPRRLPEQPDGHGQCHGLRLHPALHCLHRILLPQARERPRLHGRRAMSRLTVEKPWQRWLIRLGVFIAMVILVVPGAWVVLTAFRPNIEILARPAVWIPNTLTLNNFLGIFGQLTTQQGLPVSQYFINSLVISLTSTVIAIAI